MHVVLTALGVFLCSSVACETNPPGMLGYFRPPTLAVTTEEARPMRAVDCEAVPTRWPSPVTVWRCDGYAAEPDPKPPGS